MKLKWQHGYRPNAVHNKFIWGIDLFATFLLPYHKRLVIPQWSFKLHEYIYLRNSILPLKTQRFSKLPDRAREREQSQLTVWLILIPDTSGARTQSLIHTHMQLRAARSLWTNFFWAKYSIPLATWSPKPIRSFTVGFCEGTKTLWSSRDNNKNN